MARYERTLTIDHEIGPTGELRLRTIDGHVHIRGTDGTAAHVVAIYHVRASDEAAAERAIDGAEVRVEKTTGRLEIDTRERWWSPFDVLGQLLSGSRVRIDFDVEVPRGASVNVDGVSADVSAAGLRGRQRFKTVSGDTTTVDCAGLVDADSVSGRIEVFGPSALDLRAHSVSGRIQAAAGDLTRVEIGTTSGGVDLAGRLAPGVQHSVNSVSGGVRLATDAGVTVDLRTMSGSVHSRLPHRVESANGGRRVIVGDGSGHLRIQAVSGGLELMPQGTMPGPASTSRPADVREPSTPAPERVETEQSAASAQVAQAGTAFVPPAPAAEPQTAAEAEPQPAAEAEPQPAPDLEILRALERGEIGVEEAAARLAGRGNAEPAAASGTEARHA